MQWLTRQTGSVLVLVACEAVFGCASGRATRQIQPSSDSASTVIISLTSDVFHNTRAVRVHLPPGYFAAENANRRFPVLYMNDGFAVFSSRLWNGPGIVDSLVTSRAIAPFILVGIDNAASIAGTKDPERDRADEYQPYPDSMESDLAAPHGTLYPDFVVREVMPAVERQFRVAPGAANTGVGGSSLGGIAALVTALQHPDRFGLLLLESTPVFLFHERLISDAQHMQPKPDAVYVGVGTKETDNQAVETAGGSSLDRFVAMLHVSAPNTRIELNRVEGASHNSAAWRARLPTALTFLFRR